MKMNLKMTTEIRFSSRMQFYSNFASIGFFFSLTNEIAPSNTSTKFDVSCSSLYIDSEVILAKFRMLCRQICGKKKKFSSSRQDYGKHAEGNGEIR
ncbi:hypothetical protein EGR_06580 [Echinococcus granulosus]|uniref:Uncharacterized protein n=1 Tax=Echinococcus granulosus TaxID=6210 RepID=W6UB33_ECHGR|nr:hypothetical protein EGR_06580 [Echinococcus granulosus]EUB58593.1 hypothetical protein EGR_06580 [Echinococcus granulosus]